MKHMTTNLSIDEIVSVALKVLSSDHSNIDSFRLPINNSYKQETRNNQDMLYDCDWSSNASSLYTLHPRLIQNVKGRTQKERQLRDFKKLNFKDVSLNDKTKPPIEKQKCQFIGGFIIVKKQAVSGSYLLIPLRICSR